MKTQISDFPCAPRTRGPWLLLLACGGLFIALRGLTIYREGVNWDEFALMRRTAEMLKTGALQGGGRPGLVELLLAPFVAGCVDAIEVVRSARWLWTLLTIVALVGFGVSIARVKLGRASSTAGAIVAVALYALTPAFLRWSIQVRTDQVMLACGLAAGALWLTPTAHRWLALLAGVAFGLSLLFTQKAVYLGLLLLLLTIGQTFGREGVNPRKEASLLLMRGALFGLGLLGISLLYSYGLPLWISLPQPSLSTVEKGLRSFDHYRSVFGFAVYRSMLPTLAAHLILLTLLTFRTVQAIISNSWTREILLAWSILAAGVAVGSFHAAAFPYFWMTLGLFPCAAIGVAWRDLTSVLPRRARRAALLGAFGLLGVQAAIYSVGLLEDTQAVQRSTLSFVERNFATDTPGFQLEGALFCRREPDPFPVYFRERIEVEFGRGAEPATAREFIGAFRRKGVSFVILSHMIPFFPQPVRAFWGEHYQPYYESVAIAGAQISGTEGSVVEVDLVVGGEYRWLGSETIMIDGRPLEPGGVIELASGGHGVRLMAKVRTGSLVLAVDDPPKTAHGPFYSRAMVDEITGRGYGLGPQRRSSVALPRER